MKHVKNFLSQYHRHDDFQLYELDDFDTAVLIKIVEPGGRRFTHIYLLQLVVNLVPIGSDPFNKDNIRFFRNFNTAPVPNNFWLAFVKYNNTQLMQRFRLHADSVLLQTVA